MINVELWNAIIAAGTSIFVVILSQIFISNREKKKMINDEISQFRKGYIEPIRFMLTENYYRMYEISKGYKKSKLNSVKASAEILDKNDDWFVKEGCYLISSCYLLGCLLAYMQNIRNSMPYIDFPNHDDTEIMKHINQLVVDFSSNLKIYYVLQMNIGEEFYIKGENRVISYREFCTLLKRKEDFSWYQSLIDYYLRIGRDECETLSTTLAHIKEFAELLDKMTSGGNSIEQKMAAENVQNVAEPLIFSAPHL